MTYTISFENKYILRESTFNIFIGPFWTLFAYNLPHNNIFSYYIAPGKIKLAISWVRAKQQSAIPPLLYMRKTSKASGGLYLVWQV